MSEEKLIVSSSPHITSDEQTARIMWAVTLSLVPAGIVGVALFGCRALWLIIVTVLTAIITEAVIQRLRHRPNTGYDGSAALAGLLLAYNLPPTLPIWMAILGAMVMIILGKQVFGGLGFNIFNPALVGRVFLLASFPMAMTNFPLPWSVDGVAAATPLFIVKTKGITALGPGYWDLFIGNRGGCIGEVCILALLAGAGYLLYKGYISWHIPLSFISTTCVLGWVFGGQGLFKGDMLFYFLAGGLVIGAFFMATDYVTSPLTSCGKLIFGVGCGLITAIIRIWGGYPEGVSYSILIMNAFVPLIDKFARPRRFGALTLFSAPSRSRRG